MSDIDRVVEAVDGWVDWTCDSKAGAFSLQDLLTFIRNPDLAEYVIEHLDVIDDPEVRRNAPSTRISTPDTTDIHMDDPVDIHPDTATDGVAKLVELIRSGEAPTIADVQRMFGKPYTTAQRWLAKAKKQAQADQPIPLRRRNG
ncbi:hypothetical protein [Nonomuraea bangladeshensis]|uniref:hypothetical protein n=1 Tax=Nonomuraea bangladeshensis TaxID=404385 RepID=UPI003C2CD622